MIIVSPEKYGLKKKVSTLAAGVCLCSLREHCEFLKAVYLATRVTPMTFFSSGPNAQVSRSLVNSSCSCCESGKLTVLNKFVVLFTFPELCVPQACMALVSNVYPLVIQYLGWQRVPSEWS